MAQDATTNGTSNSNILDEVSTKAPPGTILPPRNSRELIEKTAGYVARNGAAFEERIRSTQKDNAKVSFLLPDDAYNAYYRWRVQEIKEGRGTSISAGRKEGEAGVSGVSSKGREERKGPEKPEDFAFSARMPNISAQDLEVVRLTALYVAKNGRGWMTALSQKKAGDFQFDFLRPQHSLYQFFSRLVDQYTELLNGDSVDGGRPQKKRIVDLEANVSDRMRVLERARKRAEWAKFQEQQKVKLEEESEKERVAYAQIDWHDFVVVETVVFTEEDEKQDLGAPPSLNDIQSLSLEQKGLLGQVGSDRRIEEAMPDYDEFYGQQIPESQQQKVPTPQPPQQQQQQTSTPTQPLQPFQPPSADDETTRIQTLQADRARARAAQEAAKSGPNNIKIRHNYIPAAQQARQKAATGSSICPNCHQSIPNSEMEQHLKIEMLHPDWRDQYKLSQQRSSTTNLSTSDVAANLKRLASQRSDVFDPATGALMGGGVSGEEEERRRKVERRAYDGVSGVPNQAALGGMGGGFGGVQQGQQQDGQGAGPPGAGGVGTGGGGAKDVDVQEQIRLIHERARNTQG